MIPFQGLLCEILAVATMFAIWRADGFNGLFWGVLALSALDFILTVKHASFLRRYPGARRAADSYTVCVLLIQIGIVSIGVSCFMGWSIAAIAIIAVFAILNLLAVGILLAP